MPYIAKYDSGDILAYYVADGEVTDYGVPGSPRFDVIDESTVEVTGLCILGVDVDFDDLPDALQDEILSMADNWEWVEE